MTPKYLCVLLAALMCAAAPPSAAPAHSPALQRLPNIVVIVADDLGYGDLAAYGNASIPTPNISAIAAAGVRFTDGYVTCPVCAPTRAGLMSGRYQQRFGFESNPGSEQQVPDNFGLPLSERTLAEKLKDAGYVTGMFGKWHLGVKPELQPQNRGFDEFFGFVAGAHKYLPGGAGGDPIVRNGQPVEESEYITDALAREAAAFITKHKDQPFFVYLPFNAVHAPLEATKRYRERFPSITDEKRQTFAAMLSAMDDGIGRVLAALKDAGLEDNTLVIFLSDNGGPTVLTSANNAPLSGVKSQVREGGIRVPFIMKWPGAGVPAGKTYQQPVMSLDIHATALAAARIDVSGQPIEGCDLLPFVAGKNDSAPHDAIFWRFRNQWAVRKGDWKLESELRPRQGAMQLYNLRDDLGETKDLAASMPEKVAELRKAYDEWNAKNIEPLWKRAAGADQSDESPVVPNKKG